MGRFWSLLFLAVPILGAVCFGVGMLSGTGPLAIWFPENINSMALGVDRLHNLILALIGVIFVATGIVLAWFVWKYDSGRNPRPPQYVHGNHRVEFWWTVIPTVILIGLAVYQMKIWSDVKILRPMIAGADGKLGTEDDKNKPPQFEVVGRQFEWRFRYAGDDQRLGTVDDIIGEVNELHVPVGETQVGSLVAADVLHSFFIPALRLHSDIVPGSRQIVWFRAEKVGSYEIVCAELCGWGHYKMKGRLVVESNQEYRSYLDELRAEQYKRNYSTDSEAKRLASAGHSAGGGNSPPGETL